MTNFNIKEITEEGFFYFFECMPPERYSNKNGIEYFHICERIKDNIVDWFFSVDKKYYRFIDKDNLTHDELEKRFNSVK